MEQYLDYKMSSQTRAVGLEVVLGPNPSSIWLCPSAPDVALGYGMNFPNMVAYHADRPNTAWPYTRKPWTLARIKRPSKTMLMTETWIPNGGVGAPSFWPLTIDADNDGFNDSSDWYLTFYRHTNYVNRFGFHPCFYNNVAARHFERTANLVFVDGHAGGMVTRDIMDEDQDIWGNDVYD
jgi:prepilin-type processing-associated H-X9-DG protein